MLHTKFRGNRPVLDKKIFFWGGGGGDLPYMGMAAISVM